MTFEKLHRLVAGRVGSDVSAVLASLSLSFSVWEMGFSIKERWKAARGRQAGAVIKTKCLESHNASLSPGKPRGCEDAGSVSASGGSSAEGVTRATVHQTVLLAGLQGV